MGKNVAVFVDVANIFYAAKAAGVDIDYVTLLKAATAGRDLVRAYAYTGLDPDNENQRNFHDFLRRHGYKVVSKDIRKYGDGKVKANLDIELVVDMMKTARNLDIAIVVSGDGDFAPAIRAVQEMGVRCEVISFRGNTSSDLIDVADQFTEITQIARVEKGSSRSGRRVADDEEDLSMTEVPDKQSEGVGSRARGRGRGRGRATEAETVAAAPRSRGRTRGAAEAAEPIAAVTSDGTPLVVLPGERLSRVAAITPSVRPSTAEGDEPEFEGDAGGTAGDGTETAGDEPRRRRRRRGGRGRGRGRGHAEGVAPSGEGEIRDEDEDEELEPVPAPASAPAKRAGFAFGSVWDSQIGIPTPSAGAPAPVADDEDLDEPPIPEYLIAERRQRDGGRGHGGARAGSGRGVRSGYSAAVDRERYGGSRSAGSSRFAEPAQRRARGDDRPRNERPPQRPATHSTSRPGSGDEPWSEVPPEIEAMLRAQLRGRAARPSRPAADGGASSGPETSGPETAEASPAQVEVTPRAPRRRSARAAVVSDSQPAAPAVLPADVPGPEPAAPKRRTTRAAGAPETVDVPAATPMTTPEPAAPKRRPRKAAAAVEAPADGAPTTEAADPVAPKRRAARKAAAADA